MTTMYVLIERDYDYDAAPDKVMAVSDDLVKIQAHRDYLNTVKTELFQLASMFHDLELANAISPLQMPPKPIIQDRSKEGQRLHSKACDEWHRGWVVIQAEYLARWQTNQKAIIQRFVEEFHKLDKPHLSEYFNVTERIEFSLRLGDEVRYVIDECRML